MRRSPPAVGGSTWGAPVRARATASPRPAASLSAGSDSASPSAVVASSPAVPSPSCRRSRPAWPRSRRSSRPWGSPRRRSRSSAAAVEVAGAASVAVALVAPSSSSPPPQAARATARSRSRARARGRSGERKGPPATALARCGRLLVRRPGAGRTLASGIAMGPRVVITGIGMVTPVGLDAPSTWSALLAGQSGLAPVTLFDASRISCGIAAEVKGFDGEAVVGKREARKMDRCGLMTVQAAREAWTASGAEVEDPTRVGVVIGSCVGGFAMLEAGARQLEARGPDRISPTSSAPCSSTPRRATSRPTSASAAPTSPSSPPAPPAPTPSARRPRSCAAATRTASSRAVSRPASPSSSWAASATCARSARRVIPTIRRRPRGPSTPRATASSSARARRWWCWSARTTPGLAARRSWPSSSATARRTTPSTSRTRTRRASASWR